MLTVYAHTQHVNGNGLSYEGKLQFFILQFSALSDVFFKVMGGLHDIYIANVSACSHCMPLPKHSHLKTIKTIMITSAGSH